MMHRSLAYILALKFKSHFVNKETETYVKDPDSSSGRNYRNCGSIIFILIIRIELGHITHNCVRNCVRNRKKNSFRNI